ncbi:MAG: DUF192 domain-containing protein [Atopobium sp.]|uniref:DUF192 domain-containing protein n=1 Tax=Atopobium sp. TaxID=1872650 RepID=UPI002A761A71|nr:DUF192 domain-containing protein [Atopobium sp.]MDY2789035.1 DUF192 domain-containing protein [Atopobium sp.]MDY4522272.1 DUF192 domain-containing protein [Atopobium sp.]
MTVCITNKEKSFKAEVEEAKSFWSRLRGLMLRKPGDVHGGLLLWNCSSVHCCFMRFSIDVVYMDCAMRVLYKEEIKPWRLGKIVQGAKHVLELPVGKAAHITVGDTLVVEPLLSSVRLGANNK